MAVGGTNRSEQEFSILLVDSDPDFVNGSCKLIAENGYRAWGAEDLLAAANFLADQTPNLVVVELALLETDGADPLGDMQSLVPAAPIILASSGPPDNRVRGFSRSHDVFSYFDKEHGGDGLLLSVKAALTSARHLGSIRRTRHGLKQLLEAVPDLHQVQSLDHVLEKILEGIEGLVGAESAFVAARMSDPVGKPPIEGFGESPQTVDDYVVGAASADDYRRGDTVDKLQSVPNHVLQRAVDERRSIIDDRYGVLPLTLAEHVLGLAYLERPHAGDRDLDLLQLFATQAAAAIRNAALYELATVDSTTRVFQKAFTLDRLRETVKLAWRKAFPVSVLMLDIDNFKELNDRRGHIVGDRALRHIGTLLKTQVRDSDVVGRFGGDEFLVILVDANDEGADIVADRLLQALVSERERPWPTGVPPLSTSMGMATLDPGDIAPKEYGFPDFPNVVETIVAEADAAMYQARREAKGMFAGQVLTWAQFAKG